MFLEDSLTQLFNSNRSEIISDYVKLNQTLVGSKFSQDEEEVLAVRINQLLDKFTEALMLREDNVFLDYAKEVTEARLKEGYNVKAVLRLWDWGLEYFPKLVESKTIDEADKLAYVRRIQSILIRAKLVVANANLDSLDFTLQKNLRPRKPKSAE